jgi:hypothetical protein
MLSATIKLSVASTITCSGALNLALVPIPFANEAAPLPTNRETTISGGVMRRIQSLSRSTTKRLLLPSTATPMGHENVAAVPVPSNAPLAPFPATVLTHPLGVILRILWELQLAAYRFPEESNAETSIWLKDAAVPSPFVTPAVPSPANVVTTRVWEALRMTLLVVSPMKRTLLDETTTLQGNRNRAFVPVASTLPCTVPSPTNVLTTPVGVTLRMQWFVRSAR